MTAGGLLIVGVPGPGLDRPTEQLLRSLQPGGVILFARNVRSADQLAGLTAALRRTVPEVVLFVDAEGGRVDRFESVVGSAPAGSRLAAAPPRLAERAGRWVGYSLRAFDCDVDFAPVVDLDRGQRHNALADRYLGATPRAVTARGRAFLRGLHAAGVAGCVKHFPGLGAACHDTHDLPSTVELSRPELQADLAPFAALLPLAGCVMLAHAAYPVLDPTGTPATLSRPVATGWLRHELGFDGLAVCDDLEMKALAPWGGLEARAEAALRAGCDALPICQDLAAAPAVARHLEGAVPVARRREAARRWAGFRDHLAALRPAPRFHLATVRRRLAGLAG